MPTSPIQIFPLPGIPEVSAGDDLAQLIISSIKQNSFAPVANDIFVIAQKIVSKAEAKLVSLKEIQPSERAIRWAAECKKDPRLIELVLSQSKSIIRMERGVIVSETHHGFICANAGVDASNVPEDTALLLPDDPDRSARMLLRQFVAACQVPLGVIISDTFGRPFREGLVNVALGVAGAASLRDYRGQHDDSGKLLSGTVIAIADEIAAAAELVMGKTSRVPVAVVRGVAPWGPEGSGRELLRLPETDIFR